MMTKKYILPFALILSVVVIYLNLLAEGRHGFLFIEQTIKSRYYFYQLGTIASLSILSWVIYYISSDNLKWAAMCIFLYWSVELIEFVGWYNTTPKHIHWIVFSLLVVYGFWRNDKRRT